MDSAVSVENATLKNPKRSKTQKHARGANVAGDEPAAVPITLIRLRSDYKECWPKSQYCRGWGRAGLTVRSSTLIFIDDRPLLGDKVAAEVVATTLEG